MDPKSRYKGTRSPQRWNRYVYTISNPLKFTDPSGLDLTIRYDFNGLLTQKEQRAVMIGIQQVFKRAGVVNVRNVFKDGGRIPQVVDRKHKVVDLKFKNVVQSKGRPIFGRTPTAGTSSLVSVSEAPAEGQGRINFFINVGAHELGHQLGLESPMIVGDHGTADPGTTMERPPDKEAVTEEVRDFQESHAETLQEILNEAEDEPEKEEDKPIA